MIAWWMIPAATTREFFSALIRQLGAEFDGPEFEPHVSIYVAEMEEARAKAIAREVAARANPVRLSISRIGVSTEFTKTLFVQFEASTALSKLGNAVCDLSGNKNPCALNPHLSLIYKTLPTVTKTQIASSIVLPFSRVTFDALAAVHCARPATAREDVESWKVIAWQSLKRK